MMSDRDRDTRYHIAGWILFLLCAILFLISSLKNDDAVLVTASLAFFSGCVIFLIPLVFPGDGGKRVARDDADPQDKDE